jgi:valyl-tRNA synthetase
MSWIPGFLLGLWPISVFDGFYSKDEVDYYYPTNDLVTAPEIMFFWVARMIVAGYEYRNEFRFAMFITRELYVTNREEKCPNHWAIHQIR